MAKKYIKLPKPVLEMTSEELNRLLNGELMSIVMRSIILNEKEFCDIKYDRSLRSFWYRTVKPTLEKLNLLKATDQSAKGLTKWDTLLSNYLGELVKMGILKYSDIRIIDESRRRENPAIKRIIPNIETYGYQTTAADYPHIIIATEKDTIYSIIADIASFFGCSCISGKGQNSLAAMEDLIRKIPENETIHILTMTDYDPSGYYIANALKKQVSELGHKKVKIERVGIFPHQLTAQEIEQNKYTPKPANLKNWVKETGGINGEAKGLELDAFSPDTIRRIFVTCIKKYVNIETYWQFVKSSYIRARVLEALSNTVESLCQEVIKSETEQIQLKEHDLFDIAAQGFSSIPVNQLCENDRDMDIQLKALALLKDFV